MQASPPQGKDQSEAVARGPEWSSAIWIGSVAKRRGAVNQIVFDFLSRDKSSPVIGDSPHENISYWNDGSRDHERSGKS